MKKALAVLLILVVLGLWFGSIYFHRRNQMVVYNQAIQAQWANVNVVLERRADLIPNLVATVKGYAAQEVTVFGEVDKAREALLAAKSPADSIAANGQLDGALGHLLAISENYPQLKSNENFLQLQDELAGTENRIAVERRRYNDTVQAYNNYILVFPNNIIARWAGFQPNTAYFQASAEAQQVPKVQFPAAQQ
jgi:LemA protein